MTSSAFPPIANLLLLALFAFVSAAGGAEQSSELEGAHLVVDTVTTEVFSLIRETQQRGDIDREAFRDDVYELLNPRLDWTGFSRGVMGAHFANAGTEQREAFVVSVSSMLLEFYAEAMLRLRNQKLRVLMPSEPPANPNRVSVDLEFVGQDGGVIPIVFYMRKSPRDGAWRLVNLNVSGINLGRTWRSQFSRIMDRTGDMDQAIIEFAEAVEAASPDAE